VHLQSEVRRGGVERSAPGACGLVEGRSRAPYGRGGASALEAHRESQDSPASEGVKDLRPSAALRYASVASGACGVLDSFLLRGWCTKCGRWAHGNGRRLRRGAGPRERETGGRRTPVEASGRLTGVGVGPGRAPGRAELRSAGGRGPPRQERVGVVRAAPDGVGGKRPLRVLPRTLPAGIPNNLATERRRLWHCTAGSTCMQEA